MLVSQTPRVVRLTAKDTLWSKPFFSWFVRGVGTLPIQRRQDHGGTADNTKSKASIIAALKDGSCVGLFPEGTSSYSCPVFPNKVSLALLLK